ncbi:DNA cytosine methyltransferase [Carnobacterium divergens]|uniref:DNA (cytosine-5-)-methyltransferase n=1 Tax=Carnobacterium divergens DSM 20623 TaxID=1449336 RepID=A0A0R2HZ99_CARDV|nr:DNA cytosine methyltransferase [Carnobacterium divergens]KRN57774.1 DNA-cytosine methyltransferase [Carnobacterium divergens DSM 20623]MDO0874402.1 DNA cytosine methyltransferase [Carnobacterium divergens]SUX21812.1 Modification methylase HaeIII [Carnobacterium divergens]
MLNIIDLFSGAGGLTEGFRNNSFNLLAHVEMDEATSKTLKIRDAYYYLKSTGNLTKYCSYIEGKISYDEFLAEIPEEIAGKVMNITISEETLPEIFRKIDSQPDSNTVHGIIGGPPCQAYSTIGRARNEKIKESDERIYLYKYYLKFLEKYNPDFFVFENVKGLISFKDLDGYNLLDKIKYEFTNVISINHYHIQIKLINCADFGVPQVRERLFIFGYKTSMQKFDFFKSLEQFQEKPPIIKELFKDLPKLKSGETKNTYSSLLPSEYVSKNLRNVEIPLTQNICRPNNENDLKIYNIVANERIKNRNVKYSDLPSELITHKKSDIFLDRFKAVNGNGFSHTVVAHISKDGHYYIHPDVSQNRSITVREAARIQTFPDDFYFESSRTAAFKQIGNAVPPHFSKIISQNILENLYAYDR